MTNLFCLLKDISAPRGVCNVFMEDGTPLMRSPFFPTLCLPKWVLRLFYRVDILECRTYCQRDKLWYTIYLSSPYDVIKVYVVK